MKLLGGRQPPRETSSMTERGWSSRPQAIHSGLGRSTGGQSGAGELCSREMIDMKSDGRDGDESALTKTGESDSDSMDHHFGLRVEIDRSWTVYHVFSGVPANRAGQAMTGLGRQAATEGMLSMNLRNVHRRKERI